MKKYQELLTSNTDHPVVSLIQDRLNKPSHTGKLALVVEGGGYKGAVTGAMLVELEKLGIGPDIFDLVIGTSAGAFNAAYFIAKQGKQGLTIYSEHLKVRKFLNYYRWAYGQPIMKHDILIDEIMEKVIPINWERIISSQKFYAVATNLSSSQNHAVILGLPKDKLELKQFLRASAHVPLISGKPPIINNISLYDGGMTAMLPVDQAVELGATHILALSARNLEKWRSKITSLEKLILHASNTRLPGVSHTLRHRVDKNGSQSKELLRARTNSHKPPYILTLDCPDLVKMKRFEKDIDTLALAMTSGHRSVQRNFA